MWSKQSVTASPLTITGQPPLTKYMDFYLIWGMIGTVEFKWSWMSLGELIDWHFSPNKSDGFIWQSINLYHNIRTQENHFPVCFYCTATVICADVSTSKDRGLKKITVSQICRCACARKKVFFHYLVPCIYCCVLPEFVQSYPRLVNQLWQKLNWL